MVDIDRISELIVKKLEDSLTIEEAKELQDWIDLSPIHQRFIEVRFSPEALAAGQKVLWEMNERRLDRRMKDSLKRYPVFSVARIGYARRLSRYIAVTAVVILVAGSIFWWMNRSSRQPVLPSVDVIVYLKKGDMREEDIRSVANVYSELSASEMKNGKAYEVGIAQMVRQDAQIFIRSLPDPVTDTVGYSLYNKGPDPVQFFFADSTRIELFPDSWLSFTMYPSGTVVDKKVYTVDGEVLLDVSPNMNRPVIVKSRRQKVKVIGTQFGLRDFSKEDSSAVFLYQGKVAVSNTKETKILSPNQRTVTRTLSSDLQVYLGDLPPIRWSSAETVFDFSRMNLDSAMHQIAEWYGIDSVKIAHGIDRTTPGIVLCGTVGRKVSLARLLMSLDRDNMHFSLQNKIIFITK